MAKQYQHLSLGERSLIQAQLLQGFNPGAIAKNLGRPRSCISRELARNGWRSPLAIRPVGRPPLSGGYCSIRADGRAQRLSTKPRIARKLVVGNALWVKVWSLAYLLNRWLGYYAVWMNPLPSVMKRSTKQST